MADITITIKGASDDLIRELNKVDRSVDEVTRSADKMGKELDQGSRRSSSALGGVKGAVVALGGAFAAAQVGNFVRSAITASIEQEQAAAKVAATVESMGAATWTSVDALKAQASAFQDVTTFGDEAVLGMQDLLLTFGNVTNRVGEGNDIFTQATRLGLDMSAALGQDLKSSAIQLGKALNDPLTGLTALRRVGVSFTVEQQTMIKEMTRAGDVMGAQKVILGELERQFGGTAEAMAETDAGKLQQEMNKLGDTMEILGAIALPAVVGGLSTFVGWIEKIPGITSDTSREIDILAASMENAGRAAAMTQLREWLSEGDIREFSEAGVSIADLADAMILAQSDAAAGAVKFDEFAQRVQDANTNAWAGANIIDQLNGKLEVMRTAAGAAGDAVTETQGALDRHRHSAERNRDATEDGRSETEEFAHVQSFLERETDDATLSLVEQREAVLKMANPVYALRSANQDLAEAQAEVTRLQAEGKEGTTEYEDALLKLIKANAEAGVASAELSSTMTAGGGAIAAFRDAAESAGLAKEDIDKLIESILRFNSTDPDVKTFVFRASGGGATVTIGGHAAAAEGGFVEKGGLTLVGERGPEIVDLPTGATVYPHGTVPADMAAGGNVNITVNGFVGSELQLAAEIDRLLTRRARTSGLGFA